MVGRVYRGEIYYIHETEGTGSEQTCCGQAFL